MKGSLLLGGYMPALSGQGSIDASHTATNCGRRYLPACPLPQHCLGDETFMWLTTWPENAGERPL